MSQVSRSTVAEAPVLSFSTSRSAEPPAQEMAASVTQLSDLDLVRCLLDLPAHASAATRSVPERRLEDALSARGLAGLLFLTPQRLRHLGLQPRAASRLLAAVEIARRIARGEIPEAEPFRLPADVARYLYLRYAQRDQEVIGAVLLDSGHRWIADFEFARGTMDRIAVEPRQVLVEALLHAASGCVLFHNHPSGDPVPSSEDYEVTRLFVLAGEAVGVKLVDHLVLGSANRWISLRDRRPW